MKNEYLNKKFTVKINNGGSECDHNTSVFNISNVNRELIKNSLKKFTDKIFLPNWVLYSKCGGVDGIIDSVEISNDGNFIILDFRYYYIPEMSSFYSKLKSSDTDGQWFLNCGYKFKDIRPPFHNTLECIFPSDELESIEFKSLYYFDWIRGVKNTVASI